MNQLIRILYVDDNPLDRDLVRDALEKEHGGFELIEAATRADFEANLAQGGFDLVLSDFNILGFEGLKVLDAVHAKDPRLPVIIVTGTGSEEIAAEAIKRGAADYVLKSPKHIQHLPVTILAVLGKKQLEDERNQAEKALKETNELLYLFMKHSPIYAFIKEVTPTQSRVLLASENYKEMVGIPGSKMTGMTMEQLFPPEFAGKITADDWSVLSNGNVLKLDEDLNGRNYTTIKFPISIGSKNLLAGYSIDITDLKQAEEEIRKLNLDLEQRVVDRTAQLRAAQEQLMQQERLAVLGQMAGSMGHELRNPLGVISNAAYFLKLTQPEADEKVKEYLGIIENETRTAEKIITDLLDFTRSITANRRATDVARLIQQTLERFPAPESVTVQIHIGRNLPPAFVDYRQMEQALGNLIVNAYQAMPDGGKLSISARRNKDSNTISVKDTGAGIDSDEMKKLFEPFYTTKLKGIGLGLAVSRKLAEANGGRIEAQSELGKGSLFTLFLPVMQ